MKYIFSWVLFLSITGLMHAQSITVTYAYDDLHRLSTATYSNGTTIRFTYDVLGNRKSEVVTGACALATPSVSPQNATCGSSNGSLTVNATGTSLQYSLNGGLYQPSSIFSNLAAGTYIVTIKDANNCTATSSPAAVNNVGSNVSIASVTPQNATCGSSNGSLTVNATGTSLQYSLNGGLYQPSNIFSNLAAGTYIVTIKDANNCTATSSPVIVNNVGSNVNIASVTPQNATCGSSNGSLTVNATGASLQYSLNGGLYQPSSVFSNLAVGSYTVSVKDANNCSINSQAVSIINVGVAPIANFTNSITNLTTTFSNTSANATAYNWSFGNGQTSTLQNPNVTFAAAGTYNVCLTASNSCTSRQICQSVTVSCVLANVAISGTTSFCQGSSTTLTASNGTTYRWSNGATTPSVLVNQSGIFTVTVTNSSGCTASASQTVTAIALPKADFGFNIQGGKVNFVSLSSNATSHLWRFGNDSTSTQVNPTVNYRVNQTYSVCLLVTNTLGCRDSICKPITISRVSVQDLPEGLSFSISPNPTHDIVKVNLSFYRSFGTNDKLTLVDVLGKLVFESNTVGSSNNLNVSNLADGIYFVRLTLGNKTYTLGKVVKN